ncbi:GGDEF domain-containing protein [Candidatus Peregrinibacteria bacterium]|nr:GGDEF domain-containing protein [Candidatus Peregrinibacteria bacterium]
MEEIRQSSTDTLHLQLRVEDLHLILEHGIDQEAVIALIADIRGKVGNLEEQKIKLEALLQRKESELGQAEERVEELQKETVTDKITGLPNRKAYDERLADIISKSRRRPKTAYAVIRMDLDNFKPVNESLGHGGEGGDKVLKMVAEAMQKIIRRADLVARVGGDEFGAIIEIPVQVNGQERTKEKIVDIAILVAQKLRKEIEDNPFVLEANDKAILVMLKAITISIGIDVIFFEEGSLPSRDQEVLAQTTDGRADTASLYVKHKENPKNGIAISQGTRKQLMFDPVGDKVYVSPLDDPDALRQFLGKTPNDFKRPGDKAIEEN